MRRSSLLLVLACASTSITTSCGPSFARYADFPTSDRIHLVTPAGSPDADALAARFFAPDADLAALEPELAAALRASPHDATLHEMAAYLAELDGDAHAAWLHWLRAAADERTPFASIYLDLALRYDLTVSERNATIELLRQMRASHPMASVRAEASLRLVRFLETYALFEEADRLGAEHDAIRAWMGIGAFDNDQGRGFLAPHAPEEGIDYASEPRGALLGVRWREVTALDRAGAVQLDDMFTPNRWAVGYLLTHVTLGRSEDVTLRITTSTGARVWLNGRLILSQERLARAGDDNVVIPVHLDAGWNRLLVKSAQDDSGDWTFAARFTALDGSRLAGLRADRALHDVTIEDGASEAEPPTNLSPLAEVLEEMEPELRRALLVHHDASRGGFEGDALSQARALLELAPEHPAVILHAASTYWTNDELGQALDLLNAGAQRFPDRAGFLSQRGGFYHGRDRHDRAIEDLEHAVELQPNARFAMMELAATYQSRGWREHECRVLERATGRWPDSAWAIRALGHCLQQRGYLREAEAQYLRSDALEPGNAWNLERLAAFARWRLDDDEALRARRRLVELAPWSPSHTVGLADELRIAGQRDEARALYRAASERDPVWSVPSHRLGTMAFEDGDDAAALAEWTRALERDPDNGALADRIDALRGGEEEDPDRQRMPDDEAIEAAIAAEVEIDPGAQTVLLLDDEVTTVQQDGSATHRVTQVSLAATTDGRDQLIQNSVPRSARILRAFSVGPDGERQEASSIRGGSIRFRGLDVGSRIALQYIWHSPPPAFLPNHFVSSWVFQGVHRQLGVARWVVELPRGRELAINIRGPIEHTVTEDAEHDVHVFTASGVPPIVPEPAMPPLRDLLATVTLSTLTDWGEYVDWERALLSEVFESNRDLRQLAQRLTEGATTPRERLDRIYRYVSQEIRYQQDYEDTIAGVRPHSCPVVLERGYGDCKDKAVLMILLGREVGLDIRFAVLRTRDAGEVLRDVPNQQFNHAIVYVPTQEGIDGELFMDPTTDGLDLGNLRDDDQGALALVLDPTSGEHAFTPIPFQGPELTFFRCDLELEMRSADAADATARCRVRGAAASSFRRVMRTEERASQLRQNLANGLFPGSTVSASSAEHVGDIEHPLELSLTLDASAAIQADGSMRRVRVPAPNPLGQLTRLERRRTPLALGAPQSARYAITFNAPPGGRIVSTPDDFEIEHPCFSISRRTSARSRESATVVVEFERTCTMIAPDEYPALRRDAQRASTQLQADVVIAPGR